MSLVNKFESFIESQKLIKTGEKILLGVSGGPDSMTMLDLFCQISTKYCLEPVVYHLNHKFRKEASLEAEFVACTAKKYGLEKIIEEYDVPTYIRETGLSPEEAARKIRLNNLIKWARKLKINRISLAHNKDDLVETAFLNLIRGTGLKGLRGIDPITKYRGKYLIHPLLNISRAEIECYCRVKKLDPRYDPTNNEEVYTRNKLRNKIIPYIEKEINPALKDVVFRMAGIVRKEDDFLNQLAEKELVSLIVAEDEKTLTLKLDGLSKLPETLRYRVLKAALIRYQDHTVDLYSYHYNLVNNLITNGATGKIIQLKENLFIKRTYERIVFQKEGIREKLQGYYYTLEVPGEVVLEKQVITGEEVELPENWKRLATRKEICLCSADNLQLPLTVRSRLPGDRFIPLGMEEEKKLKDYFIDEKIAVEKRDKIPIIVDNNGNIIWVAGFRMDERFKITDEVEKVIKLCIKYPEGD